MTRDDIIRMARKAGAHEKHEVFYLLPDELERFAALVAAAEREACAKASEAQINRWIDDRARYAASECAAAIRAGKAALEQQPSVASSDTSKERVEKTGENVHEQQPADEPVFDCPRCGHCCPQPAYRAVKTVHEGKPYYVSEPEQQPAAPAVLEGLPDIWHKAWPDAGSFVRASAQDLRKFAANVLAAAPEQKGELK